MELRIEDPIASRKVYILYFLTRTSVCKMLVVSDNSEFYSPKNRFHLYYIDISCAKMIIQLKHSLDGVLESEKAVCNYRIKPCKAEENWQFYLEFIFPKKMGEDVCYVYFAEKRTDDGIQTEEYSLFVEDLRFQFEMKCFSPEKKVVDSFFYFMEYLDFATNMEYLEGAWRILREQPVSGRKAEEYFQNMMQARHMEIDRERLEEFLALKKSTHLQKKWDFYWKRKKQKKPDLSDAIGIMYEFFKEIIRAIKHDEILVADWMPQLGRFL